MEQLIALVDRYQSTTNEWETETLLGTMREAENAVPPHLRWFAHCAVEGAIFLRRQADAGKSNGGGNLPRNMEMARECILLRRDPANDARSDRALIDIVRVRPKLSLKYSAARAAILDGLRHPSNLKLTKDFGDRGSPNAFRSIFNGTRRHPYDKANHRRRRCDQNHERIAASRGFPGQP
jgi:hypothetical protein